VSAVELDLDAIRARVDNATEGPWVAHSGYVETVPEFDLHRFDIMGETISQSAESRDAEFIAHARTDVPALLAEVERLREWEAEVEGLESRNEEAWEKHAQELEAERDAARAALADTVPAQKVREAIAECQDEYESAMDEVESLREGTREHGEWVANAHAAAETRDRLRALLPEGQA
jgi:hypothetical protein